MYSSIKYRIISFLLHAIATYTADHPTHTFIFDLCYYLPRGDGDDDNVDDYGDGRDDGDDGDDGDDNDE